MYELYIIYDNLLIILFNILFFFASNTLTLHIF